MATNERIGSWAVGPTQRVTSEQQLGSLGTLYERYDRALRAHEHLWVATVGFFSDAPLVDGSVLSPENMVGPPVLGCYVCEAEYEPGLLSLPCPGDPRFS